MHLKIFFVLALLALTSGQRKYYSLEDMPETNFDCRDKILGGYYADPEANCQMFHVCVKIPGQGVQDFRFLCPNETAFDQENQICADSGDIDCESSGLYFENFDLYRLGSSQSKRPVPQIAAIKGAVVPLGPSTKSPILTNNIYEDDDFYLQKSETGDRRLHSKDLLRGSSSSNFFNNKNKGKDLEEDDEDTTPRKQDNNNQFRPKPNPAIRPKTQYQSQFRKAEPVTPTTTTQQPTLGNLNQINDKKRAKVAVRKLTRKRPEEELETIPTQQPQQPFTSFTTQVTQKFGFGDSNTRYNTVNRPTTTLSPFGTSEVFKQKPQQPQQQPQQPSQQQFPQTQPTRVPFFKRTEQTTPAFFEASPGAGAASKNAEPKTDGNRETTPFSLLRNPIVAAGPNFNANQNRGSNNFQQNRQTTANYPQTTPNGNVQTQPPSGNFQNQQKPQQQARPIAAGNGNFQQQPQSRPIAPAGASSFPQQQNRANSPVGNTNFQQQPQQTVNNGNFPQNRQQINNGNFQQQSSRPQAPASNGNFQQQTRTQAPINNGNFQQPRQQASAGNGNFQQQGRQQPQALNGNFQQNRQSPPPPPPSAAAAAAAPGQNYQQINRQSNQRQSFNRNFDEFDEGDNQEFLKTAPSNNFRPSDINSFTNNYKTETKNNNTRFGETSTTKYITPTIITTPRPTSKATPAYDTPPASRQNFYSTQTTSQQSNFYSPTVSTTQRVQPPLTSTLPPTSRLPQRIYPSSTSAKPAEVKDVAYDYAYYDDSGSSFADYGSFDHLGEPDFSRTTWNKAAEPSTKTSVRYSRGHPKAKLSKATMDANGYQF